LWPYPWTGAPNITPPHNSKAQISWAGPVFVSPHHLSYEMSDFEWDLMPSALERMLICLSKRYRKPMYVTENGIADASVQPDGLTADDTRGVRYLAGCLRAVHNAMEAGADVRGYFYFCLVDSYEWAEGYDPQFGLYKVDRTSPSLDVRPTLRQKMLREVCARHRGIATDGLTPTESTHCPITTEIPPLTEVPPFVEGAPATEDVAAVRASNDGIHTADRELVGGGSDDAFEVRMEEGHALDACFDGDARAPLMATRGRVARAPRRVSKVTCKHVRLEEESREEGDLSRARDDGVREHGVEALDEGDGHM